MTGESELMQEAASDLAAQYGEFEITSPIMDFDYTDYYAGELGPGLKRRLVSVSTLRDPAELVAIKIATTAMEESYTHAGRRRINIDPGYLALAHLILATGKGYTHRPYLGQGVYADLTLVYQGGDFRPLPWTYPDYQSPAILDFLRQVRAKYVTQLRAMRSRS